MNDIDMPTKPHHGRNLKRVREMMGIKQEALAITLGGDWSQRKISLLEQKDEIDSEILDEVASGLKVSPEAIKDFNEEAAVNVIGNSYHDHSTSNVNYHCTFNPIDKIVQLYDEKIALYERMLKDKEDMIDRLTRK